MLQTIRRLGFVLAVLLMFSAVSCSSAEDEFDLSLVFDSLEREAELIAEEPVTAEIIVGGGLDLYWLYYFDRNVALRPDTVISPFYGKTLTIFVESDWAFRHRMISMADGFERMHPGVSVELVFSDDFNTDDFESLIRQMAEDPPLLFQASTIQYPFHEHSDNFADWMPVLASHPGFDEDEWNMNVLSSSLIGGELIAFPAFQGLMFVSANRTIPGLASLFEVMDGITTNELLELHAELASVYGGFSFFWRALRPDMMVHLLSDFFDYESRKVEFHTEEFIDLLEQLYDSVHVCDDFIWQTHVRHWVEVDEIFSDYYFFRVHDGFIFLDLFSVMDYDPYFVNPLPIINNDGTLRVEGSRLSSQYSWILNSHVPVYQALAAEFLLYMAGAFGAGVDSRNSPFNARSGAWGIYGIPARLDGLSHFDEVMRNHSSRMFPGTWWRYDTAYAANTIEDIILRIGSMEMRRYTVYPMRIYEIIATELHNFTQGTISARDTAARLQNRVVAALSAGG